MTREQAKKLLPVITAFAEGKTIEVKNSKNEWNERNDLYFVGNPKVYRIKPEPTYRPFESAKEFLNVMKQHTPCGWVRPKDPPKKALLEYQNITSFDNKGVVLQASKGQVYVGFPLAFETLVFSDGRPFGVYKDSDI